METQENVKNIEKSADTLFALFIFAYSISKDLSLLTSRVDRLERLFLNNRFKLSDLEKKIK